VTVRLRGVQAKCHPLADVGFYRHCFSLGTRLFI
jgi:hypothetical protein